ncbi:NAD-dependent malic enzyme [Mycobacterium nebraskense]|uniref:NAD-dependent malic enzyme n=1 Tax=Mycobacterium nebraskense TaxID=244292 RepID=UPI0021F2F86B|nr:NAD-dependent malic enzyme [Mycobacterium nebraskense]MCV7120889.1 NAD-dependent malic enzyme [Mycobacterium nebraskense]
MYDAHAPRIPPALSAPSLNRGVGFTHEQRRQLGLTGRLPSAVLTLDEQADRVWHQLQSLATDLGRNLLLEQLHYRHELLYYKVLEDHLPELMPVVYTPTVGEAIQRFSDEYRGQRGLFLSIDEPDEIEAAFATFALEPDDVDLIVCTDAEAILGIGDWGVGGIQIAVGKLALYTAGAGIDPRRCIAVSLDVGTNNEQLLQDPFYLGNRHARRCGEEYEEFVNRYIETAHRLFPKAILHFEDFGPLNARRILRTYGEKYCVFNDDIQGTGAVVVAAVYGGCHLTGVPMRDQRVVVFGAGTAGIGVADQIRDAMMSDGDFQVPYAKNRARLGLGVGTAADRVGLVDAIKLASPTILLGSSAVFGAFTEKVVQAMTASCERPMIFPLSNPTSRMEAMPDDVLQWSDGKALITTGTPVAPIEYDGTTYTIGQANNVLVFPGIGLGIIVAGARLLTSGMLQAAAKAVVRQASPSVTGDSLLPDVKELRAISTAVAEAVYHAAVADGVATRTHADPRQAVLDTVWTPAYD